MEEINMPQIEIDMIDLAKAKKRVPVRATSTRKAHYRMQDDSKYERSRDEPKEDGGYKIGSVEQRWAEEDKKAKFWTPKVEEDKYRDEPLQPTKTWETIKPSKEEEKDIKLEYKNRNRNKENSIVIREIAEKYGYSRMCIKDLVGNTEKYI